jgi:hypothetical protein
MLEPIVERTYAAVECREVIKKAIIVVRNIVKNMKLTTVTEPNTKNMELTAPADSNMTPTVTVKSRNIKIIIIHFAHT